MSAAPHLVSQTTGAIIGCVQHDCAECVARQQAADAVHGPYESAPELIAALKAPGSADDDVTESERERLETLVAAWRQSAEEALRCGDDTDEGTCAARTVNASVRPVDAVVTAARELLAAWDANNSLDDISVRELMAWAVLRGALDRAKEPT